MPTGAVRVDANPASAGACALKIFAVIDAVVAAQPLVELVVPFAGERRVGRAQRLSEGVCTSMGQAPNQRAVACASQGPLERNIGITRPSWKIRRILNLLSARQTSAVTVRSRP